MSNAIPEWARDLESAAIPSGCYHTVIEKTCAAHVSIAVSLKRIADCVVEGGGGTFSSDYLRRLFNYEPPK